MKLTKIQLKQIIKEELSSVLSENEEYVWELTDTENLLKGEDLGLLYRPRQGGEYQEPANPRAQAWGPRAPSGGRHLPERPLTKARLEDYLKFTTHPEPAGGFPDVDDRDAWNRYFVEKGIKYIPIDVYELQNNNGQSVGYAKFMSKSGIIFGDTLEDPESISPREFKRYVRELRRKVEQ